MFKECQAQWNEGNATNIDLLFDSITSYCATAHGLCKNPLGFFFPFSPFPSSSLTHTILQLLFSQK